MSDCLSLRDRYFAPGHDDLTDPIWLSHLQGCEACRSARRALPRADRALADLTRRPVAVPPFEAIAGAAAEAARRQRRRQALRRSAPFLYTALGTAAVAAGLIAALLVTGARRRLPVLLGPGAEIQATAEARLARLACGARIRLDAGTLKLASADPTNETLVMPSGRISVEVPKLPAGTTLSVRTPDAEVRVRGTRFQVARTAKETQVSVSEGVVEVRPEGGGRAMQTLKAGESVTVPSIEVYREALRRSTFGALDQGQLASAESQIALLLRTDPDAAQRAEAQALLAWSLSARGRREDAVEHYREALTLLPTGPRPLWAENACAEMSILIEQKTPSDGPAAWAECLRRFPDGVHATLARSRLHSAR